MAVFCRNVTAPSHSLAAIYPSPCGANRQILLPTCRAYLRLGGDIANPVSSPVADSVHSNHCGHDPDPACVAAGALLEYSINPGLWANTLRPKLGLDPDARRQRSALVTLTLTLPIIAAFAGARGEAPYVFDIVGSSSGDAVAASLSSNVVRLFALQTPAAGSAGSLQHLGDLTGHTARIQVR